jgi:hypothetical protein
VTKGLLVSNVEDFNICPLRRIRHPLNQQKVRIWPWSGRRNKNCYDRSQYVYENKQNDDKMTGKFAYFGAQSKPFLQILQKIAGFEGQFTAIFAFGALPCGYSRRASMTSQESGVGNGASAGGG